MVALPLLVMVALAFIAADPPAVAAVLGRARWGLLALAFAAHFDQYPVLAMRWRYLVQRPDGPTPGLGQTMGFVLIAHLFNLLVPGPGGEIAGSYLMKARAGVPMSVAMSAGAYGRLFGMLLTAAVPLALASGLDLPLPPTVRMAIVIGLWIAVGGLAVLMMLALWPAAWERLRLTLAARSPTEPGLVRQLVDTSLVFMQGFGRHARHIAATPRQLIVALALSALALLVNMVAFHGILLGMQVELSFRWGAFLFCILVLGNVSSYAIPASGNVTSPVISMLAMTTLFAVDEATALGTLFLAWLAFILQGLVAFVIAVPHMSLVTEALARRRSDADAG